MPSAARTRSLAAWIVAALCWGSPATLAGPGPRPVELHLRAGSFDPRRGTPALDPRLALPAEPQAGHFILQLARPIDAAALDGLRAAGAVPLHYLPDAAYVVRVPAGRRDGLAARPGVRWLGAIQPGWKLAPDLGRRPFRDAGRRGTDRLLVTVDLFPDENPLALAPRLELAGIEVLGTASFGDTRRITARARLAQLEALARIDAVAWIEELGEPTERNDNVRWVVQADQPDSTPLWSVGLRGEGQIIGHIDGPIATESCWFVDPTGAIPGPDHRKIVAYRAYGGPDGAHGTHTAGSLAGDASPINRSLDHAGLAPAARISHTDMAGLTGAGGGPSNLYSFLLAADLDGARVHSNSWGDDGTTAYTAWCRDADLYSYEHEDALVLFAASNTLALTSPENAKNVLAVAASFNGSSADSMCSGGAGPTSDGRRKPEITAPGCGVVSAAESIGCDSVVSSGTSMATPAVAAGAALVRQYFLDGRYPSGAPNPADARVPSGALVKALLLNSATDMTKVAGYPGPREGWGRLRLDDALYFAGDARGLVVLADVRNALGLSTGVSDGFELDVADSAEPLELTLVYTEPPAALLAASATVNDLDLELISPGGTTYRGNVFDSAAGWSVPGGEPDALNNVETVLLPVAEPGRWSVRVRGAAVNQGTQGYALLATGGLGAGRGGALRYAAHAVDDTGPRANGNGLADPGETIAVRVDLLNLRGSPATAVTATLYSAAFERAGVTAGRAAFPDIPPESVAGSSPPHFEVAVSPDAPCGEVLPFVVRAVDGTGVSESAFGLPVGAAGDPGSCQPYVCGEEGRPVEVGRLEAARDSSGSVRLSWPAVSGAAGYRLWRDEVPAFGSAELAAEPAGAEWIEDAAAPGTEAPLTFYRVRAVNSCGQEGP